MQCLETLQTFNLVVQLKSTLAKFFGPPCSKTITRNHF